jgi:hypothetical protein
MLPALFACPKQLGMAVWRGADPENRRARVPGRANLGFEAQLFLAADKLRKNLEPSDYKHVALGLIFLKHISNAFEARRAKLLAEDHQRAKPQDIAAQKARRSPGGETPLPGSATLLAPAADLGGWQRNVILIAGVRGRRARGRRARSPRRSEPGPAARLPSGPARRSSRRSSIRRCMITALGTGSPEAMSACCRGPLMSFNSVRPDLHRS